MNVVPFGLCQVQEGGLVDDADAKGTVIQPAVVSLVNQSSLSNGRHSSEASALAPLAADPQQLSAASADPTTPRGKFGRGVGSPACAARRTLIGAVSLHWNVICTTPGDKINSRKGLYNSAKSERGNRYVITPRGSYIDYGIENDSIIGEHYASSCME